MKTLTLLAALCGMLLVGLAATPALADDDVNPNTVTNQKIQAIRIPEAKFDNIPLSHVIQYLEKESLEHDPGPVVTGVRFIYMPPKGVDPNVKLTLRNATMSSIIELVCLKTGFDWDFRDGMIVVKRATKPASLGNPTMETQSFYVNRELVQRAQVSNQ